MTSTRDTSPSSEAALDDALLGMEIDRSSEDPQLAAEIQEQALLLGRDDLEARARLVIADASMRAGDLASAAPVLDQVNQWAADNGQAHVLARSHLLLAYQHFYVGDMAEARRHGVLSVQYLPEDVPPLLRGAHFVVLAMTLETAVGADASRHHHEALDIATTHGNHQMARSVLNNMAYGAYQRGEVEKATQLVQRLQELSETTGIPLRPGDIDTVAAVATLRGDYDQAEALLLPLVNGGIPDEDEADLLPEVLLTLVQVQRLSGAIDRAMATVERCLEVCESRGGLGSIGVRARRERALLHAARGDFEAAFLEMLRYDEEAAAQRDDERERQAELTQLVFEVREGRREAEQFRDMALRDALTGLYNRRFLEAQLSALEARARAEGMVLSLAVVDVDHFKQVNDTTSHLVGDQVLRQLARRMEGVVPATATVARLGGEEFVVVLPEADEGQAFKACERLRLEVRDHDWSELVDRTVTVSVGVATARDNQVDAHELMRRADENLYRAKRAGRDQVVAD
jgi:diguanylate cyclase (GGDEF)-like protein